jgi:hypothetical protein
MYPAQPSRHYVGIVTTSSERTLALAQRLLLRGGLAEVAAPIRVRYSKTLREASLSNGCQHCDALQGHFPVGEEVLDRVVTSGVDGLDTLVVVECPVLEWQRVLYEGGGICV